MHAVVDSETLKESPRLTYMQILEANNVIQTCGDETYWLAVTRTVQRSTQFPISACIVFSFLNCFYRYPSILRKIETRLKAEELADRARNLGLKLQSAQMGWLLPAYYLFGREWLLSMGMLRPQDAAQDIVYVLDFWRRFQLAWRRNDGHLTNREYGHRAQILPDRTLEVFAADMHPCASGDALYEAAHQFMATASQYCFLVACESRTNVQNSGPYRLDEGREMLIRDFMDLAECALPWLDGVASDIPYNDLTVTITTQGCHFNIVDDWGSFESVPEFTQEMLTGVGLYTSDALSEGFTPIGMGSADELASVLLDLTSRLKQTMTTLWNRMSGWSRDQLLDAGALTYYAAIKDLAHVAGVFAPEDWLEIDPRAEQFRPLLNDEYAESLIGELVGGISLPGQQSSPFGMMQHADRPARIFSPLPCSLVIDGDYLPSVGELRAGTSHLEAKNDRYRTTRGVMTAAEYNAAAGAHEPAVCSTRFRYLCEAWVKYHRDTPLADELYRLGQGHSRRLKGNGANYTEDSRKAAMASMHRLLHGLALRPNSSVVEVAELIDVHPAEVLSLLEAARGTGRVVEVNERFMLSPLSRIALETSYSREYADVRGNKAFIDDYEAFERINVDLKGLITDWQTTEVGGDRIANNHEDNDYDLAVIDRLGALHDCVDGAIARLGREIPRLNRYRERLLVALKKAEDGEFNWLSDAQIDSYHTVWFQLHEDLLRIVGRRRME
jgi:hypothetical protein